MRGSEVVWRRVALCTAYSVHFPIESARVITAGEYTNLLVGELAN